MDVDESKDQELFMMGKRVIRWASVVVLAGAAVLLLSLSSCAHNQHLVSINVIPGNGTFAAVDPAAFFNYHAYGTYIHPPKTVEITSQATWVTDNPQVAGFTAPGVVSPNTSCGVAQIWATMHDSPNDIVSNEISITVDGPASEGCPQSTATNTLAVNITGGSADGIITSSPAGISCGGTGTVCAFAFPTGTVVTLSATPTPPSAFLGWAGTCPAPSGNSCSVLLNTSVTISASFN